MREVFSIRFFFCLGRNLEKCSTFSPRHAARVEKIHRFRLHIAGQDVELLSLLESEVEHGACSGESQVTFLAPRSMLLAFPPANRPPMQV